MARCQSGRALRRCHSGARPTRQHEAGVVALLDDLAKVQDDDAVGILHRAEPVGDHERGPGLAEPASIKHKIDVITCAVTDDRPKATSSPVAGD